MAANDPQLHPCEITLGVVSWLGRDKMLPLSRERERVSSFKNKCIYNAKD